jgi:hypothetical protein
MSGSSQKETSTLAQLASFFAVVAAVLAVLGGLWYAAQSFIGGWVYDPVGVVPREVGLTSSALFTQSTAGLIGLLLIVLLVCLLMVILLFVLDSKNWLKDLREGGPQLALSGVRAKMIVAAFAVIFLLVPAVITVTNAWNARASLQKGKHPTLLWGLLPAPWRGEVAMINPVDTAGPGGAPTLPACALYLGQADGTVVLIALTRNTQGRRHTTTLRVPASSLRLALRRDFKTCP